MASTPVSVLRQIAARLGCGYDEIEKVLMANLGGSPITIQDDPGRRLDAVRRKLGVGEGQCVVAAASHIAQAMQC